MPSKGLRYGVDGSSDTQVAEVGVVPVDDVLLEACRDNDFVIDRVHCDGAKSDSSDSTLVG